MVLMALLTMGLAVYAAGAGARVLVGAAVAGLVVAVLVIRSKRA